MPHLPENRRVCLELLGIREVVFIVRGGCRRGISATALLDQNLTIKMESMVNYILEKDRDNWITTSSLECRCSSRLAAPTDTDRGASWLVNRGRTPMMQNTGTCQENSEVIDR